MEQQPVEDHHMRLPPPVTSTSTSTSSSSGAANANTTTTTNHAHASAADSYAILHPPSHHPMQPADNAHSHSHLHPHPHSYPHPHPHPHHPPAPTLSPPFGSKHQHHHLPSASSSSLSPAYSPPTYAFSQQNHDPSTLAFPDPPSTELAPLQLHPHADHAANNNPLPSLASLTGTPAPSSSSSSRRFPPHSATPHDTTNTPYSPPPPPPSRLRSWPSGNPYSAYYAPGHGRADSPLRMDIDATSNGNGNGNGIIRAPLSPDNNVVVRATSVSLDDPDVRMAAEALGDLRAGECFAPAVYTPSSFIPTRSVSPAMSPVHVTDMPCRSADFVSSPQNKNTPMPTSPQNTFGTPGPPDPEPLLSLVMTSGSLLAKPIEGTVSAYNTTKNFSPGFIKTPVEYVEGVVGSGLHLSGIEGGVRWFFRAKGRHQPSGDLEAGENGSHKRRKVDGRGMSAPASRRDSSAVAPLTSANGAEMQAPFDPYGFTNKDRRLSMSTVDTLPAYDDARSPAYTEELIAASNEKMALDHADASSSRRSPSTSSAWQSRLIMSTSGLSIAMSEESLRSLKYCLSWLRWANEHIGRVIKALKDEIERYDTTARSLEQDKVMSDVGMTTTEDSEQARMERGARIVALRKDVLRTLQGVIETVSKYAGGALPDNARALVRRHLTSLPQRFRLATQESGSGSPGPSSSSTEEGKEKEIRDGAQRVLVLAKEGLDMMAQVSNVLDGTIVSAEEWCERLGKKKTEQREQGQTQAQEQSSGQTVPLSGVGIDGDVKMGGNDH